MRASDFILRATRRLYRRPGVPVAAVLILGLSVGLCTGLFGVVNAVVWRPLPFDDPDRLVRIETMAAGQLDGASPALLFAFMERARTVTHVAAARDAAATIEDARGIDRLGGRYVSASYLDALGIPAFRGRLFMAREDAPGAEHVIVLSHRLWEQRFDRDESVVGRVIALNGQECAIIGIMSPAIDDIEHDIDWWAPLALAESQRSNRATYLEIIARLSPGSSPDAAQQELTALARDAGATADDGSELAVRVTGLHESVAATERPMLTLLFGAVIVFLGIACVNVASLMFGDAMRRRTEMAVRTSLGGTRSQLARESGFEAVILCGATIAVACLSAQWLIDGLVFVLPPDTPRLSSARLDTTTMLFAIGACVAVVGAGTLLPMIGSLGGNLAVSVGRRTGTITAPLNVRRAFVIAQIALTVSLAIPAALLIQSARSLDQAPRGYRAEGTLTAAFTLPRATYPTAPMQSDALASIVKVTQEVGGVDNAAIATRVPLAGAGAGADVVRIDESFEGGGDRQVRIRLVSPGFFRAMGIEVSEGRDFNDRDAAASQRVVIVNQTLARRLRPNNHSVGTTQIKFSLAEFNPAGSPTPWEVVGVVSDTFDQGPRSTVEPELFVPLTQAPLEVFGWMGNQALLVWHGPGGETTIPAVRAAITGAGLRIPLYDVRTVDQRLRANAAPERTVATLAAMLAAIGFMLSGVGVFAVMSEAVRQRRRDTTLRLALGASPSKLITGTVGEALWMAGGGVACGALLSLATTRLVQVFLFGVTPTDPATVAAVMTVSATLAAAAAWLPARSIAALDLVSALREE